MADLLAAYESGGMDKLVTELDSGCPACKLATMLQYEKKHPRAPVFNPEDYDQRDIDRFDYKKEELEWRSEHDMMRRWSKTLNQTDTK